MINLIEDLQNTTKRNEKIKLLETYKHDTFVRDILFYTYNPNYQYFVKKIWPPEKEGGHTLLEKYSELFTLLTYLRKRYITGHDALQKIKEFMETLTSKNQKLFEYIITKDLKCGVNIKSINKIWPDLLPESDFQLAEKYNPEEKYMVDYWYWSKKLDGFRMKVDFSNMVPLGRNGKEIKNTEYILKDLEELKKQFSLISFVDGEVCSGNMTFNQISSILAKHKFKNEYDEKKHNDFKKNQLKYYLFNILTDLTTTTEEMLELHKEIKRYIKINFRCPRIEILDQFKILNNYKDIHECMLHETALGYEGIMLRHPKIPYDFKRSDALLKFKPIFESDLKCTDFEFGKITMYKNGKPIQVETLSAIYVEGIAEDGKKKEFVKTRVGSGFTFEDRKEVYNNPDKFKGKLCEIHYQEISKSKDGKFSLRFPVFKRWRFDKCV